MRQVSGNQWLFRTSIVIQVTPLRHHSGAGRWARRGEGWNTDGRGWGGWTRI